MSLFAWRWTQRKIPTDDILKSRGVSLASKCQCCEQEESLDHLFFSSSVATQVWTHFGSIFGVAQPKQTSNWKININWRARGHLRECIPFLILWFLWIGRNDSKHRLICLNDILIFSNGSADCVKKIRELLFHYENTSGQLINSEKSLFITSNKVSLQKRATINLLTGFQEGSLPLTYLGAPLFTGNRKSRYFQPLITKALNKLKGWELKYLSPGSRLVLIKSVLCSLPIYLFHVLEPPGTILHKLEMICAKFFWGAKDREKKIHWIAWQQICHPKSEGGLDIRHLKASLSSFSIKMWVRFRSTDSLWSTFLRRKYCSSSPPAAILPKAHVSPVWRRLMKIKNLAESHIRWNIGKGDLSFWYDSWLNAGPLHTLCEIVGPKDRKVDWFLEHGGWNKDRLELHLIPSVLEQVIQTPISPYLDDRLIWKPTSHGRFTSKSVWELVRHRNTPRDIYTACWSKILSPTMSLFAWRWTQRKIPTDDILKSRGVSLASKCQCCEQEESLDHLFFSSSVATQVWTHFGSIFGVAQPKQTSNWKININWRARLVAFHGFLDAGSILKAELTAILQGLLICLHQQLFPIWVETDSAVAMQIIISDQCSWDLRHILTSIQGIRANHATRITHIHREGNAPADFLASLGMEKRAYAEYFGSTFDKRLVGLCKLDRIGCPYLRIARKLVNT
ncbi:hypothetical protein F511_08962 [Dorcoceras hygrometricum]|uniref:Uncharacterized protein n=1 Tax=Dorcoceras hygrometricum TaxID=472368 RepID=A0A2Z7CRC6_9LAMI|nr:hypothetical protein F511_08962 [Dorcoceras hygrometricum]